MDNDQIAAAILAAGFVAGQRNALTGGVLENTLKEKYVEFLAFVQEQNASVPPASKAVRGKKKK